MAAFYNQPGNVFRTGRRDTLAPPANVDFVAMDEGVSNPKFARLSLGIIPATEDVLAATQIPLTLTVQPLAEIRSEETPVPMIDCLQGGPPRCSRCRTYMNPAMRFISGGARFTCNICGFASETPAEYYAAADNTGRRQDWHLRPELQFGTCDFLVGKEYWFKDREPKPVHLLFAVDVSEQSLVRGVPAAAAEAIRAALYDSGRPLPTGARVAIMTFDRACHFYNLGEASATMPQVLHVTDVEDVFVPLHEGLFVDPTANQASIQAALQAIAIIFETERVPEPALGAVTKAVYMAMHDFGGKLELFLSALPTWGPGKLKMRDQQAVYNTVDEKLLYDPASAHWKKVAEEFVEIGVGVDMFLFPGAYIDVATVGTLAQQTGGDTFYYQNFIAKRDAVRFTGDLLRAIHRFQGTSVQMKMRCSNNLDVVQMLGNFTPRGTSDLEMGVVDADKAVTFVFKHDGKLDPREPVHFQSAVLMTTLQGQRILRIHNITAPVTALISESMRSCDTGAMIAAIAKMAAMEVLKKPLKDIKQSVTELCVKILCAYRKHCAPSVNAAELIMPESLKFLPLLTLAVQKQPGLRTDHVNSDVRVVNHRLLRSLGVKDLLGLLYPRLIAIHALQPEECFADDQGTFIMPPAVRTAFARIEPGGAYLLDNGQYLLVWLKSDVSPQLITDLYGPGKTLDTLDAKDTTLPQLEALLNAQVRNLVAHLNAQSGTRTLVPQLARQSLDGSEILFAQGLIEDRGADAMSYPDFMVHVHRQVNALIAEQQQQASSYAPKWYSGQEHVY
ncbi:Sec23/Sec24 trunk domain-domain-containing protein [Protomyces lactucae-debilis]|uniref:Sec23/Sec24 trunk domain-domain-containing protein n=1 Tax=Protomyces lactucae-debilis TaxID=2754530 RepID=A0A1Y2F661_PROLT|nr:Sec23/Sec24 trunk domain-containing protein [Protomyces lactucae-debilis]ORY79388.1 Sec23/Sec24 trunk domain-domain-containing protein [Protomyces lactucae-debilis]